MTNQREHEGKVALVLGGSRGIGAAIVERLAADGAKVAFTYASSADQAAALAARVASSGGEAAAFRADSADVADVESAFDLTLERFGRLDIVVVNAGILRLGTIDQISIEDFDRIVAVNIRGVFAALRKAATVLGKGGRILTIGSNIVDRVGFPGAGLYAMTKAAVATLVKGAAIDLASRGITVNNIQPGPIATDMTKEHVDFILPNVPLGRMGQPQEIAGLTSYLARDEAAFATGASLTMDGGYSV
ncbi:SDR family oxidoreductase [Segnochrobactrum spirostomi]|uniref:SDR family oxidoreductase n=1 Tax=Segnochrobactrum spirostomi TaxID=2608987 RepID=A0A6A7Y6W6_9HYPH|nr:SDR family oxidoreductase [Segnochrobactrum spirostomi]MQT14566.1 SDR family oxidoreductase [Segnochrobactrum spirostomi]